jgi:hypothetical protein
MQQLQFTIKETNETITISKENIRASFPTCIAFKHKTLDGTKIKALFENLVNTKYPYAEDIAIITYFDGSCLRFKADFEVVKNKFEQFDKYFDVECNEDFEEFIA